MLVDDSALKVSVKSQSDLRVNIFQVAEEYYLQLNLAYQSNRENKKHKGSLRKESNLESGDGLNNSYIIYKNIDMISNIFKIPTTKICLRLNVTIQRQQKFFFSSKKKELKHF